MVTPAKKRLAILISGRGSNMESIRKACADPDYPASLVLVISDNPNAAGLETAESHGISAVAFDRGKFASRADHEAAISDKIDGSGIDLICLAGYMRLLSADFTKRYEGRLINIHPSLLPDFKGLDTHQRAIDAGVHEHGCTVHHVNSEMDGGEIIAQARVPVLPDDTPEALAARVLVEEHRLYPKVIEDLCTAAH